MFNPDPTTSNQDHEPILDQFLVFRLHFHTISQLYPTISVNVLFVVEEPVSTWIW